MSNQLMLWVGALLYDNVTIKVVDAACADFKMFFDQQDAIHVAGSNPKGMAEAGPSRHKASLNPVTFASSLSSRDWTSADEFFLRESFWGSTEFGKDRDSLRRMLPADLVNSLSNERLFCERITACKPLYQCVGALQ